MAGGTVKGRAFPSKSKCEALTLMSAESEPSKSSMKEFTGSPLDGVGEIDKIQNKQEKCMDGPKTDVRFCGEVVGNVIKGKGHFVCEGNDEERDIVDEIKLNTSDYAPITGKTRGYLEEVNDGGSIANNIEERNIEEIIVKENAPLLYGLDIKYPNIGEERKSLEVATNNIVDGGSTSELQITGKTLTDYPQTQKEDNEMHIEVPIGANMGIESVIYGLDIIDTHIREERKNLDVVTGNMVDGGVVACALQIMGNHLTDNSQIEKEANKLNTELSLGTSLDNETVVYGVDIKDAVVREERMSLEMGTDNMVDCTLPTPKLQIAARNLINSLQNEKEANWLKSEVAMGNSFDNETVVYEMDIKDAVVEEEIKSLDMATDKIVEQTLSVPELQLTFPPELQITSKNPMDSLQNEKEANSLKSEVAMGTNLCNVTMIFGVDISDANTREGKSLNVTKDNIVYGGFSASELQREGKNLIYNPHDEKEANKLNTEVPMGTNLDNETVVYGVDIKNAVVRQERKSLEMPTDNMIDRPLPAPELKITGKNLTDSLKIGGKANWVKPEVAMGTNLDNEAVVYRVDIKDAVVREERKGLKMATDSMVDQALLAPKHQITGIKLMHTLQNEKKTSKVKTEVTMGISLHHGTVIYGADISDVNTSEDGKSLNVTTENIYNLHDEKKTNKMNTEVPMGTNLGTETVVFGVDIKGAVSEERKCLDMATENMIDRALPAPELQLTGENLTDSVQNEKEQNRLKLEVAMSANLDRERVVNVLDIKEAVVRVEKKSLGMATDNMVDQALPAPELQITGANLMDSLQNEKEANRLKNEVAVANNLHNETVICGDISDLNTREGGKSLNMTTDNIVGGGFTASEFQIEGKNVTYDPPDKKEANELNTEVPIFTNLDNGKMECGSVDASVANNAKESPNNVGIPKRRRLNRKMFEKTIFGNNEASMNNAKPQSLIANDPCIEVNDAHMSKHVRTDDKAETKPLVNIGRKMNRLRRKQVLQRHAGTATANDEQKSQCTDDEPHNKVNKETDELDMKNENAENSRRNKEEKVEPERNKKVAVERNKSSKKVDVAGMIFICSSETKNDCFHYGVLALPACKRYIVSKIYDGMRLFLFDCDLKMMYGIFKAVGPGGFNIEPMAFGSQYPSQVRFAVVEDCNPLVEEKFRSVIKDNYYTKHKFHFQLTNEQVRNLCQLFHYNSKTAESKLGIRIGNTATPSPVQHDRKRRRVEDSKRPSQRCRRHPTSYEHNTRYETEAYVGPSEPPTLYDSLPPLETSHIPSRSYDEAMIMDMHNRRDLALDHHSYIGADAYNERVYATGAFHAYEQPTDDYLDPECETGLTQEQGYENGVNCAYPELDYGAGLRREYETGVIHGYGVPTHETVACHVLQEPTRVDAYRQTIHETGVIHASREPRYQETIYDANQEPYGYTSGRQQVMYYEHDGQYYRY